MSALRFASSVDLFHNCPFKTDFNLSTYPEYKTGAEMVKWLDEELKAIEPQMAEIGAYNSGDNYGRADRGAALLLHARLWLNAHVYDPTITTKEAMEKAKSYADQLVGKYSLSNTEKNGYSGYQQLFMADNDVNHDAMKEIIFPIRQDGLHTMTNSCGMYLVNSFRKAGMPDLGTTNGWSCNFSRAALVRKFFPTLDDCPLSTEAAPDGATEAEIKALDEQDGSSTKQIVAKAGDDRALFYGGRGGGVKKRRTEKISTFTDGLSIVKWDNHRSDGKAVHNPGTDRVDVDVPLFRYAEVLMIEAEANFRLGNKGAALGYINQLRDRAGAQEFQESDLSLETICDEWCREFYAEGRRRSDLVRFGVFAGNSRALNGNMINRKFGLNNALMLIFAFAGSYKDTLLIHASLVRNQGYGYAFIAKSGTGKSTHTSLWMKYIEGCDLMNDDNPIIRFINGKPWIYGSPWSGKTPCYRNVKAPLGAITRIDRAKSNSIELLNPIEAFASLLPSCSHMKWDHNIHNKICDTITRIIETTKIYTLHCLPNEEAAKICHKTILKK